MKKLYHKEQCRINCTKDEKIIINTSQMFSKVDSVGDLSSFLEIKQIIGLFSRG
jgi:hypothetical protein